MKHETEYMHKLQDPANTFVLQDDDGERGIAGIITGGVGIEDRIAKCIREELDADEVVHIKIVDEEYGYVFTVRADYRIVGELEGRNFKLIQAPLY